jgi:hypothetical protein
MRQLFPTITAAVLLSTLAIAQEIPFSSLTGEPVLKPDAKLTGSVTFSGGSIAAGIGLCLGPRHPDL